MNKYAGKVWEIRELSEDNIKALYTQLYEAAGCEDYAEIYTVNSNYRYLGVGRDCYVEFWNNIENYKGDVKLQPTYGQPRKTVSHCGELWYEDELEDMLEFVKNRTIPEGECV